MAATLAPVLAPSASVALDRDVAQPTLTLWLDAPDTGPTLAELVAGWLLQFRGHTLDAYRTDLRHWVTWCDVRGVDPVHAGRTHVQLWVRELGSQYAPATVARRLGALKGWHRWLADEGVLEVAPSERVRAPKVPNVAPPAGLSREQCRALLDAGDAEGPRDAVAVGLLLLLGLRASELGLLDAEGLTHERGHLTLTVRGKGGRVDRLPVPERLAVALEVHLQGRTAGPLLTDSAGARLDRHDVRRIVARLCKRAGVPVVGPHELRHATVTLALAAGVPLHRVQDLARHADPATTRRYQRAQETLDGHGAYRLADWLGGDL